MPVAAFTGSSGDGGVDDGQSPSETRGYIGVTLMGRSCPAVRRGGPWTPALSVASEESQFVDENATLYVAVTYDHCHHVVGPFFHGTKAKVEVGTELVAGHGSNYEDGRVSNNIYFSALVEAAAWGAELATALAGSEDRGHIYVVEPLGPFEDDPNVTNKRFPGNVTQSYRTHHPLRVVAELDDWEGHPPDVVRGMLDNLALLREQGLDVIED